MKIFFDHQIFSEQTYGGISRYYTELISGINNTTNHEALYSLIVSNNVHLREKNIRINEFFPDKNFPKKVKAISFFNKYYNLQKVINGKYDVFHATYYDPYFLPYIKKRPLVVTFLDMIHEKFGNQFPVELAYDGIITKQKQLLADRADRIIAISESTKRDIVDLLNVNPSKIDVIYLGNSLSLVNEKVEEKEVENYFLFVGNRDMYKNFKGLVKAISPVLKKYNTKLICAGGGKFSKNEIDFISSFKLDNLILQRQINDQTLAALYRQAIGFIFPSMYEGFGIPVLEAFACGCPVIVSNVSSLPEVAGEAGLYINPVDYDCIQYEVERLLNDGVLRKTLIQRGYEQLKKFSWEDTVHKTVSLYENIK